MSETIKIIGGIPLKGEIKPIGNKNSMLKVIPAALLSDKDCFLRNIPKTTDVLKLLEMLTLLGANVDTSSWTGHEDDNSVIKINCKDVKNYTVDYKLGSLIRSSIMLAGPLLARFGIAKIPMPGGCTLGYRGIHAHIDGFTKAGCTVEFEEDYVVFKRPEKLEKFYEIWQNEASVTGTENLVLYTAGTEATFEITDAACEPHTQELCKVLAQMGAKVDGIGSNKLTITGSKNLNGFDYTPGPDQIDIAGIIVAAAVTKGHLTLKGANVSYISKGIVQIFRKFNINITENGDDLIVDGSGDLYIDLQKSGFPLANTDLPKFVPRTWPGYPVDALPAAITLACKTKGQILMLNWIFETGLDFTRELNAMGAHIFMADPGRIIVTGPVTFKGGTIHAPDVIQANKAIFLAALADNVETTLIGSEILKRRYPDLVETYTRLGAKITQVG